MGATRRRTPDADVAGSPAASAHAEDQTMTWWLAVCSFLAAVATFLDLRSTHVGIGLGLREVGKLARKWGLTTLTVINVASWLLCTIGGAVIDDEQVSGACALVLLVMTLAHVRVWQANAEKIDIEVVERGTRRVR